jgi:hypothetical protein
VLAVWDVAKAMSGAFGSLVTRAWCAALLACLCGAPAVAEEPENDPVISLSLTVDPVKSNGSPWDGYPAVGGRLIVPDPSNAPDIAVCLVYATGAPDCVWRTERGERSRIVRIRTNAPSTASGCRAFPPG